MTLCLKDNRNLKCVENVEKSLLKFIKHKTIKNLFRKKKISILILNSNANNCSNFLTLAQLG